MFQGLGLKSLDRQARSEFGCHPAIKGNIKEAETHRSTSQLPACPLSSLDSSPLLCSLHSAPPSSPLCPLSPLSSPLLYCYSLVCSSPPFRSSPVFSTPFLSVFLACPVFPLQYLLFQLSPLAPPLRSPLPVSSSLVSKLLATPLLSTFLSNSSGSYEDRDPRAPSR